ncbi:MFS transporter [Oceanirhabdus sp. W0125-5]|uniref:MFS transporter n=1 Tax=Oceanirhabdus sp. W0125-5 TaxID=2999116 RepID=UPI0022F2B1E3|nr:MFS transporter [Oceanirhabdus sp. W0125-5]WBW96425.1 MFS transporter [Oceanirhabdus sp. W0125-5]
MEKRIEKVEFRNRIYYIVGNFISLFGSSIYKFAIGLYVLKLTESGLFFAGSLIFSILPSIIMAPITGVIVDRVDKKKLIVIMDIINGCIFLMLFLLFITDNISLWIIYGTNMVIGVLADIFNTAFASSKPKFVFKENLMSINSIGSIISSISSILGPVVGGLIFGFIGLEMFVIFNGISFLISAIMEALIDFKINEDTEKEVVQNKNSVGILEDMKGGFRYIKKREDVVYVIVLFIALNFYWSLSLSVPIPYITNNVLGLSSEIYGIIQGGFPVGMIIGAILVKRLKVISYMKIIMNTNGIIGGALMVMTVAVVSNHLLGNLITVVIFTIMMCCIGICVSFINIPIMYFMQKEVEEEFRGRVWSAAICMVNIVVPIGYGISGVMTKVTPSYTAFLLGVVIILAMNITTIIKMNKKQVSEIIIDIA